MLLEKTMSLESVKNYLKKFGADTKIIELEQSSATVELAAQALHTQGERIAKTLSFWVDEKPIVIVCAGNVKIDNARYRHFFGTKAKMIAFDQVEQAVKAHMLPHDAVEPLIGHAVGGVCPFAVNPQVTVYLDASLKKFETVFPACGSANSAIELTIPELEQFSQFKEWIDVTKNPEQSI